MAPVQADPRRDVLVWDVFCRVIDNYGDAGVCWRLAADLAGRGDRVRLVIDDPAPLRFMAPEGAAGVEVLPWPGPATPGDVAVEAFGCDPPEGYVAAMAAAASPPAWVNLEYLSAEPYVERSHGLPSPQRNGRVKRFWFPGFTPKTGGLLREPGLDAARAAHDRGAWLAALGVVPRPGERVASLFCYDNPMVAPLLAELARQPTVLLLTPGPAQAQVTGAALPPGVTAVRLPWLTQRGYDELLWSCDLNFVRGEDSLVRAIWAGAPFVWQAYPQHDGAHHAKVEALLARLRAAPEVAAVWRAWNGMGGGEAAGGTAGHGGGEGAESASASRLPRLPGLPPLPPAACWRDDVERWRDELRAQRDLATSLRRFALAQAAGGAGSGSAPGSGC